MPVYMKYGNAQGTAKGNHKGWIVLETAMYGTHTNVGSTTGQGVNRDSSSPAISEIVVTRYVDIGSTELFQEYLHGEEVKVVIDFVSPASKNDVPYLSSEMEAVTLTSYNVSGHGGGGENKPMESLELTPKKITYRSTPLESSKDPKNQVDRIQWDLAGAAGG